MPLNVAVPAGETVTVDYATADETATAGSDYVATSGTLVFEPGERSKFIYVTWSDDGFVEPTETYLVVLSRPSNATLADSQGRATILDDDVNQRAPVTTADSYTTTEDTPLVRNAAQGVLANDTDPDTLPEDLMARLVGASATNHGSVILNADGSFTYTPSSGFSGIDQFSYFVNDGAHDSSDTVTINVTAVNDAPTATNLSAAETYTEDTALKLTDIVISDGDSTTVTATLTLSDSAVGSLNTATSGAVTATFNSGTGVWTVSGALADVNTLLAGLTFTPAANGNGDFTIATSVSDGALSVTGTKSVTGTAVNDAPTITALADQTIPEGGTTEALTFRVSDAETAAGALTVTATSSNPTLIPNGNLTLVDLGGGNWTIEAVPVANQVGGPATITVTVSDGTTTTDATFTVTVTAVNDAPVADAQTVTTAEDTANPITLTGSDVDNDSLTYAIVTGPQHGTLTGTGGMRTYTPNANYTGSDTFTFTVNDGTVDSAPATVTIDVTPVNDGPTVLNPLADVTVLEGAANTVIDLAGATPVFADVETAAGALIYTVTSSASSVVTATVDNTLHRLTLAYQPNVSGTATITVTVSDGELSASDTFEVTVTAVNRAPLAVPDTLTATEDTEVTYAAAQLVGNDTDVDSSELTIASVTSGVGGTVVLNGNGTVTFTPTANFNGEANFSYTVTDGDLTSDPATVTVNVAAVNDAPSFTTGPDQAVQEDAGAITVPNWATSISAGPSDESGQQLTFVVTNDNNTLFSVQPTVAPDGTLTFASAPNVFGTATVTVMLRDDGGTANGGSDTSAAQTFSLTVNPVNDGPTVLNPIADVTVPEDAADTVIDLAGATPVFADVETAAGALTYSVTSSAPSVVAATVDNVSDKLTLAYPLNASGTATITVTASDGVLTVSDSFEVTVTAVNQAPVADAQTVTTTEDTAKTITLSGSDSDADSLTYTIVDGPQHGTLTGTGATRIYTPNTNYGGPDSFTFTVNDGTADSNVATVTIDVTAVNDAPVLGPIGNRSVSEEDRLTFIVNASDPDGLTTLAFSLENGVGGEVPPGASIDALGTFTWTPTEVQGPGSYTFDVVATETGTPALAGRETITVVVSEVNRAPILQAISDQTITAGQQLAFTAVGIDFDLPANIPASTLTYSIDLSNLPPGYGTLNTPAIDPSTGVFTWTPAEGQVGAHVITVRVENELRDGLFAEQQVRFNVESANHAPVLNPIADQTINEGETLTFTAVATDPDVGQVLTFSLLDAPEGANIGTLSGVFSWIPTEAQGPGNYQVTLAVSDGVLTTSSTISITVSEVNQAPVANAQSVTTPEDSSKTITLTGSDGDGNPLTYTIVDGPTHGTLTGTGATRTYTPTANYNGPDSFTFRANDGTVDSVPAMVAITVTPVNDVPVADAQMVTTAEDTAKPITLTGSDVENDPLTFSIVDSPQHGTLIGTDATRTYTPAPNFSGTDSFTFRINDGQMDSNVATVTITVTPAVAGVRWINSAGGDWNVASNWSTGVVPTGTDDVVVDLAGTYTITHSTGTTQIKSLKSEHQINLMGGTLEVAETVEMNGSMLSLGGGTLKNSAVMGTGVGGKVMEVVGSGTFDGITLEGNGSDFYTYVSPGAQLTIVNGMTMNGGGLLVEDGHVVASSPSSGSQTIGGTSGGILLRRGDLTSPGATLILGQNIGILSERGSIGSVDGGIVLMGSTNVTGNGDLNTVNVRNMGHIQVNGKAGPADVGGVLAGTGFFFNEGSIEAQNGSLLSFERFENSGAIRILHPGLNPVVTFTMTDTNPVYNLPTGTIEIWNDLTMNLIGSLYNEGRVFTGQEVAPDSRGVLNISGDVTVPNSGAGIWLHDGEMKVEGTLVNLGTVNLETGLLQVGDYVQEQGSSLSTNLASLTDFGRLAVDRVATLNGILAVAPTGALTPGDRYRFMTFGSRGNSFEDLQLPSNLVLDDTDPGFLELVVNA